MKKVLIGLCMLALMAGNVYAAGVTGGAEYQKATLSSSALSADGAIKATGGVVYGVSGYVVAGAAGLAYICDGDVGDSETAASQLISIGNVDGGDLCPDIPDQGIRFPTGIYLNEKSGNVVVTVYYK